MRKQLSASEARRLVDGLHVAVNFIRTNIPADVIATKQIGKFGWKKANAALELKPNTNKNLTQIGEALMWTFYFIKENYQGDAGKIADAILLLSELGFLDVESTLVHPVHITKQ